MGKKNHGESSLGRSLIKDRFGGSKNRKFTSDKSMLHTTEVQDGYDWGRLNLQSVTEESSFQEFLSTAELAGTEFQAEKLNIKYINPKSNVGLLNEEEKNKMKETYIANEDSICIPRRPPWNKDTTAEELESNEREHFLCWRRELSKLQEEQGILLTPFEKNLEFWRQLWRVVERSDVVIQIVDARNPLLFRCPDLEKYVKEVSSNKLNLILVNKADFLTEGQRVSWAKYFDSINIRVVFFSAVLVTTEENVDKIEVKEKTVPGSKEEIKANINRLTSDIDESEKKLSKLMSRIETRLNEYKIDPGNLETKDTTSIKNCSKILSRNELIELFRNIHTGPKVTENITTIGLVGYPNVGKSSTINALLTAKKVSVSATPGKTKHFQTLFLDKDLLLCDCPGLVMPSFVYTKAEMVINGILPIDQMRDHVPPINLVCNLIPRHVIEDKYGLMLPPPLDGEDPHRPPFAEEVLNAYGYNRGFMTANGQPDNPRAARYILKDFVNGKLLFAHAPPGFVQEEFHIWPEKRRMPSTTKVVPPREAKAIRTLKTTTEDIDRTFFNSKTSGVHTKGKIMNGIDNSESVVDKPWKKINKHENKKKREKLRRVYAHLDQH